MTATLQLNKEHKGIEIIFSDRPDYSTRQKLKEYGFRWHNVKKLWYARQTDERMTFANALTGGNPSEEQPANGAEIINVNKFGVRVGDIFYASWGYEQTNVDFFQVVALVGNSSVRVREVYLPMIDEKPVSGMSADRVYKVTREILPAVSGVFIKDDVNGDIKRLKSYAADGVSNPQFRLSSFCDAYLVTTDTIEKYESWYY